MIAVGLDLALRNPSGAGFDFVRFVGRFHPLVVHLPIGFLLLLGFAEALTLSPKMRTRIDPALGILLPPLLVSAVGAFALGLLLARDGGFPTKLVAIHRNLTLAAVVGTAVCVAAWSAQTTEGNGLRRGLYRAALGVTLGLISIGAHFGGSITRGETYLTKYAPPFAQRLFGRAPKPATPAEPVAADAASEPLLYRDLIAKVIEARCAECHGATTTKGSLRLDSLEAIVKGGENGPALVVGRSADSAIVMRMLLPVDRDEHMPPEGKPGPTPEEIEVVRFWIDRGASPTLRVKDALPPEAARTVLAALVAADGSKASSALPSASAMPSSQPSATPSAEPSSETSTGSATPGSASSVPSSTSSGSGVTSAHSGLVWQDAVKPLLAARCGRCHGPERQKGKLRVDSIDALVVGGKTGPAIVAGNAASSTLLARMGLPIEHTDHMPPRKEPQLDANEIALVTFWIEHGANAELKTASLPANLRATPAPAPSVTSEPTPAPSSSLTPSPAESNKPPPLPAPVVDPTKLPPNVRLYADVVRPILAVRCGVCHSGQGPSGELAVDNLRSLVAKDGAVVPGDPDKSRLLNRIALTVHDPDHMPPDGMPQLERGEIDAVRLWITKGATDDLVVPTKSLSADVAYAAAATIGDAALTAIQASGAGGAAPASSAAPVASAAPSSATPSGGPPSLGPGGGCAACSVGGDDTPLALALGASMLACAGFVARRRHAHDRRG